MRDQCVKTVATTKSHIVASIRTPATVRNVELAVIVVFTARTSAKKEPKGKLQLPDKLRNVESPMANG